MSKVSEGMRSVEVESCGRWVATGTRATMEGKGEAETGVDSKYNVWFQQKQESQERGKSLFFSEDQSVKKVWGGAEVTAQQRWPSPDPVTLREDQLIVSLGGARGAQDQPWLVYERTGCYRERNVD